LYLKAEKNGCPSAKYNLAERYRTGGGLPKDPKKAKAPYEELAKIGDKTAAEKLKLITSD
jgi:TPR repeat protein